VTPQIKKFTQKESNRMTKLPVELRWPDNAVPYPSFTGAPCVKLQYTFLPSATDENGVSHMEGLNWVWALLDTGADRILVDASLVPACASQIEEVTSYGINGVDLAKNYQITLNFPEWDWCVACGAITMPSRSDRPYGMILGRQFLQLVQFTYDGRLGIVDLERIDNPSAI
jgi:hypothetical protein